MDRFPKMISPTSSYWESLKTLCKDLEDSYRYVHPCSDHFDIYSLRYYELLLRACTDFESLCKQMITDLKLSQKNPNNFNIKDYQLLAEPLSLTEYSVGFYFDPMHFRTPLENWRTSYKLRWYQDYNHVKHNRVQEFKKATLSNVLDAIGALFLLITSTELAPMGTYVWLRDGRGGGMVYTDNGWPLIKKTSMNAPKH